MRLVLKLKDQNLPGLTRELALEAWRAVDAVLPERPGVALYRDLYRAVRGALQGRVGAMRYCGCGSTCHVGAPGERIFVSPAADPPEVLIVEVMRVALRAAAHALPRRKLKGLARLLRRQIEKTLRGRLCPGPCCGETELCDANEAYDPWDMRDPQNQVPRFKRA